MYLLLFVIFDYLILSLFAITHKMSQTSPDIRTSLYIDALQSQSLHDRSLEVNMDAVKEASVSIYKVYTI